MRSQSQVASITLAIFVALWSLQFVTAHDGGHFNCVINMCPPGHTYTNPNPAYRCPWTDPECGTRAVDGCDVRNQNAINFAGGFFPDYGVDICGSNRIVDCNQNEIRGGGENSSINIWGNTNVTIRRCRVTNYMVGIFAPPPFSSSFIDVERNTFTNMHGAGGVALFYANNVLVKDNTFLNTGPGGGVNLQFSSNANVSNNIFRSSDGLFGCILLISSNSNFIGTNNLTGCGVGVSLTFSSNNKIHANVVKNGFSILLDLSNNNVVHRNVISEYEGIGIALSNSNSNNVTSNVIRNGSAISGGGIALQYLNTNNYVASNILENNYAGVWLLNSNTNTVWNNTIRNNRLAGIWLRLGSNSNVIQNNTINNNTYYGILIENSNNERVDWNYVCWNGVLDFRVNNSVGNNGTNNRCNRPDNWTDIGALGCTFRCPISGFPAGSLDYGDAPDPPYASLLRNNGARHSDIGYEILGTRVSADLDAKVPDRDEFDDGITFPILRPFSNVTINITVTVFDKSSPWYRNPLFLSGWFDWNNDGSWSTNEKAFSIRLNASTFQNNTEILPVTFMTPQINGNTTWARIRLSYRTEANVTGEVLYGEVEDYVVNISTEPLLTVQGSPRIGTTMNLSIDDPLHPGASYVLGMSFGTLPGIRLNDGRIIPLNFDIILFLSLQVPQSVGLSNNIGTLNTQGEAVATWSIPNIPGLVGNTFYFAFVTLVQTSPPIASISRSVNVTVLP